MTVTKKEEHILWWVRHPALGVAVVDAPSWELATVEAAKWWKVPWSKIAATCEPEKKAPLVRNVCIDCGKIFWGGGDGELRCSFCQGQARFRARAEKENAIRFWKEMRPGRPEKDEQKTEAAQ